MTTAKGSKCEQTLGLQPGELYGADEVCHTDETKHAYRGKSFEVYYDQLASPLRQWKAFCAGIGTIARMDRDEVITEMREQINADNLAAERAELSEQDLVTVNRHFR